MSELNETIQTEEVVAEDVTVEEATEAVIDEPAAEAVITPNADYFDKLRDLWLCIAFCIAGWVVACIGFATNPLIVVLGVLIVDRPCFRLLLQGASIGAIFGSIVGATRIITYSDGHKERDDSGWSAGLAVTIFSWLITLVIGVVVIVVRIFRNFFTCFRIYREEKMKTEIKEAFWLPIAVGLGVFFIGLIVVAIAA